ncbi:hypothetical protein QN277_019084 [Acacia crassicarpa]|uniref:Uncharacterized protein n=1 Tax=Acacia crassicarpa TaxID=499986 RepID=A0AAE1KKD5_9FABA|nr:hypothetical protein QN277_019084 [Acacia crassicarpa]
MTSPSQGTQTVNEVVSSPVPKTYSLFHSSSQTASIKLDRTNFLVRESVVLPVIKGNRLQSHISSVGVVPLMTLLTPGSTLPVSNPEFEEWYIVDRMLIGWLRNTMTQEVAAQLLHCRFAFDLWTGA